MTVAHTEGPWHRNIKPATKYPVIFAGRNTHVAIICTTGLPAAEVEANLALVKSSPTMLKALRDIELLARVNAPITDGSPAHRAVMAAIAEAEGRV